MTSLNKLATDMFGPIEWVTQDRGFMPCPGINLHTGKNAKKDCRIITSGAPTIFCLHSSCLTVIEEANLKFRRACATGEKIEGRIVTFEEKERMRQATIKKRMEFDLQFAASVSRNTLFKEFAWPPADMWEESPVRLSEDPLNDWKLFLKLFDDQDILWNGKVTDSGFEKNIVNFRKVSEWRDIVPEGNFTCGSIFKEGSFSRSNENVVARKFLIVESDTLGQEDICAIFNFCRKFMKLRAVVYTGGKSLHGWMDFPTKDTFEALTQMLPPLGCDPKMFTASQPCRMPGIMRGDKIQSLLYLNL